MDTVPVLNYAIKRFVAAWNADARPFRWAATADKIMEKAGCYQAAVQASGAPLRSDTSSASQHKHDQFYRQQIGMCRIVRVKKPDRYVLGK
jgi:hypothetical protein